MQFFLRIAHILLKNILPLRMWVLPKCTGLVRLGWQKVFSKNLWSASTSVNKLIQKIFFKNESFNQVTGIEPRPINLSSLCSAIAQVAELKVPTGWSCWSKQRKKTGLLSFNVSLLNIPLISWLSGVLQKDCPIHGDTKADVLGTGPPSQGSLFSIKAIVRLSRSWWFFSLDANVSRPEIRFEVGPFFSTFSEPYRGIFTCLVFIYKGEHSASLTDLRLGSSLVSNL